MSTRLRFLTYFGLLSAVGAITFVVLWFYGIPQFGIEGVQTAEYRRSILAVESLADKERDVFAQWFVERRRELRMTVSNELFAATVRDARRVSGRRASDLRTLLERQLVRIKEANSGVYNYLYLVNPADGRIIASTEANLKSPPSDHQSILTESAQAGLAEFVYLLQTDQGPELVIADQVVGMGVEGFPDGGINGVLVASIGLNTPLAAEQDLLRQALGSSGAWTLMDRERRILVFNAGVDGGVVGGTEFDFLRQAVEPGSEGFKVITAPGQREVLMAFRHLNLGASDGLTLTVMRDADEALTSIRANFVRLVTVGVLVFLLAMGLVLFAARRISATEEEVRLLNAHLEARVEERTEALERSNQTLTETLQRLEQTQDELVESEKLASLGALVAGVAHELNTPIGNALMAASTLSDEAKGFAGTAKSGMTRSAFDAHLANTQTGTAMIMTNIARAAELISGFKQLAVDQTSAQRRVFNLGNELADIRVAMGPTLRAQPVLLIIGQGVGTIMMDSYPGALSSSIINLINNSILHGFEGRRGGVITIDSRLVDPEHVEIVFADDGNGMTDAVRKHLFEPFFTTKLGRGGSGLGMHIVYNNVTKLLGGRIELESSPGNGTRYRLLLPVRPKSRE
jgi:signal transduction histidine kinase